MALRASAGEGPVVTPVRLWLSCPTCGGNGEVNPQGLRHTAETCPRCHGNLHVPFVPEVA
jgi:DnaJ-class molecular chaperone